MTTCGLCGWRIADYYAGGYRCGVCMGFEEEEESFVCPQCGARSFNENDIAHGYCGRCHDFTGGDMGSTLPETTRGSEPRTLVGRVNNRAHNKWPIYAILTAGDRAANAARPAGRDLRLGASTPARPRAGARRQHRGLELGGVLPDRPTRDHRGVGRTVGASVCRPWAEIKYRLRSEKTWQGRVADAGSTPAASTGEGRWRALRRRIGSPYQPSPV